MQVDYALTKTSGPSRLQKKICAYSSARQQLGQWKERWTLIVRGIGLYLIRCLLNTHKFREINDSQKISSYTPKMRSPSSLFLFSESESSIIVSSPCTHLTLYLQIYSFLDFSPIQM